MADRVQDKVAGSNTTNEQIAGWSVELSRAQRAIDEAAGTKRAMLKRAKAEGVPTEALLAALRLKRLDNDDARKKIRDLLRCALVIAPDLPLRQDDLFDRNEDFDLAERAGAQLNNWNAEEAGYGAGLNGGSLDDCPFPAGSPHYERFRDGYIRGQGVIAARMGENAGNVVIASTRRRKPTRQDGETAEAAAEAG